MDNEQHSLEEMLRRLKRAGYLVDREAVDPSGSSRMLVGKQWMTLAEMSALASQDSEVEEKY